MTQSQNYIRDRIQDAVAFVRASPAVISPEHIDNDSYFAAYRDAPDDTVLDGLGENPFREAPNEILIREITHLGPALDDTLRACDLLAPSSYVPRQVLHERQHALGYAALGLENVGYGIKIFGSVAKPLNLQPFSYADRIDRFVTKLEFAAVTALPTEQSPDDTERLRTMGYTGIDDVYHRVVARNVSGKGLLPLTVPLGYSPARDDSQLKSAHY